MESLLSLVFALVAGSYASVGQAGGTGYVAVMGLAGFTPDVIKPTALALNILVAGIGCSRFYRAGLLTWRSCYPFGMLGAPFSLLGGAIHLPAALYQPIVGALLLLAAAQMLRMARFTSLQDKGAPHRPPFMASLLAGGVIGLVSGITGVGGGIFLAPLILWLGWTETRKASAVSAAFNLLNSAAALAGTWATMPTLPTTLPWWLAAVGFGALIGSWLGVHHLPPKVLRIILSALLLAAGLRMILA
ncbi:sulfite exporter TauE/SafE family protein [Bradyrhizobium yuanmingense]|uniref:sulfite exporter TauE/SafE family protein n=1 Tax=Bradyrhizobium yuanmingense TaxID=108015 RepID=UPI00055CC50B|nr:sulfite exporter TauE/SafE family protein [Bradyrhizobium yuanmingense]